MKRPRRQAKILGRVRDVEGSLWYVRQIRDTSHGFDLLFGSPPNRLGSYRGGLPRLIPTKELYEFWDANRTRRDGVLYDLPAGRTTLKRWRRRLGFHSIEDLFQFWDGHREELETLSAREFARRYNIGIDLVFESRFRVLGRQARDLDWWKTPQVLEVLRSGITLREIGEKLSISISHAKRLRDRALRAE